MKSILINMHEMSLSKEVYDKNPNAFFSIFIYGLLIILAAALLWAYFGQLDVVVRAHGIIRPHTHAALVINSVHGDVHGMFFYEGQQVNSGDILFAIDTFHLENEHMILTEQLETVTFELLSLELLLKSIDIGENIINDFNTEFSVRFDTFWTNINAIEHGANNRLDLLKEEELSLEEALSYARFELEILNMSENSILGNTNLFNNHHADISNRSRDVYNTHRNRHLQYVLEMENLNFQLETIQLTLTGFQMVRDSIDVGYSLFDDYIISIYRNMHEEYLLQYEQLTNMYIIALEQYDMHTLLYQAGVVSFMDMQTASTNLENARVRLLEYNTNFIIGIDNEIRNAENSVARLQNQVEILHVTTLSNISSQMFNLESIIQDTTVALAQSRLQQDAIFFIDGQVGEASMLRLNEINRILEQINLLEQEKVRLTLTLSGIDVRIDESTVRAPIDGTVTIHTELTDGAFVMSGVYVLSILPIREEVLNAHIFVSNNDIGRIVEGIAVRYDIAAMPRRDFGDINGIVTRISSDILSDQGVHRYFLVESEIEDRVYYDTRGNAQVLRVGMGFDARIVVEQQRILFYLLDRLNLLIN